MENHFPDYRVPIKGICRGLSTRRRRRLHGDERAAALAAVELDGAVGEREQGVITADADARAFLNSGGVNIFRDSATVAGAGRVVVEDGTELQLENGFDDPLRLDNEGTVWITEDDAARADNG